MEVLTEYKKRKNNTFTYSHNSLKATPRDKALYPKKESQIKLPKFIHFSPYQRLSWTKFKASYAQASKGNVVG